MTEAGSVLTRHDRARLHRTLEPRPHP